MKQLMWMAFTASDMVDLVGRVHLTLGSLYYVALSLGSLSLTWIKSPAPLTLCIDFLMQSVF